MEADSLQGALADAATARNMTAREQEKVLRSGAKFRELLIANSDRLLRIFKEWDENGDGQISVKEFRRALPMLGIRATRQEVDVLFESFDQDGSGAITFAELSRLLDAGQEIDAPPPRKRPLPLRVVGGLLAVFNFTSTQTLMRAPRPRRRADP